MIFLDIDNLNPNIPILLNQVARTLKKVKLEDISFSGKMAQIASGRY
jgi:hypothetical protein